MAALTMARMTRNMPICLAELAISFTTKMSSMPSRVYTLRCFQRRIGSATCSGVKPGAICTSTAFTLRLLVCRPCTASSRPGLPGRLKAGLAAVRARSLTMASLSFRNCVSCASFIGTNSIGSPPDDTMRRVSPTTV
ncbi:hypothetical protein D9M69_497040 [compost metagenome]